MTDEELIKKLRDKNCCESPNCNCDISADRIEALTRERDHYKDLHENDSELLTISYMQGAKDAEDKAKIAAHALSAESAADDMQEKLTAAEAKVARLVEALEWYAEQTRLCQLAHSSGDAGRNALHADGGKRARAALTEIKGDDHE